MHAGISVGVADDQVVAARRVLDRVMQHDEQCWVWPGRVDQDGYGLQWVGRKPDRKLRFTHRLVYTLLVGPVPDGKQLDHLCRNRRCCNPSHLEPVTTQENTRRGVAARTTCRQGHAITTETAYRTTRGHRACRICQRESHKRWRERTQAEPATP